MLKRILWAMLLASSLPAWAADLPSQPKVGEIAPPMLGKQHGGNEINLEHYRGKVVIATFWAHGAVRADVSCRCSRISGK